jgi:hypothetical protein
MLYGRARSFDYPKKLVNVLNTGKKNRRLPDPMDNYGLRDARPQIPIESDAFPDLSKWSPATASPGQVEMRIADMGKCASPEYSETTYPGRRIQPDDEVTGSNAIVECVRIYSIDYPFAPSNKLGMSSFPVTYNRLLPSRKPVLIIKVDAWYSDNSRKT